MNKDMMKRNAHKIVKKHILLSGMSMSDIAEALGMTKDGLRLIFREGGRPQKLLKICDMIGYPKQNIMKTDDEIEGLGRGVF